MERWHREFEYSIHAVKMWPVATGLSVFFCFLFLFFQARQGHLCSGSRAQLLYLCHPLHLHLVQQSLQLFLRDLQLWSPRQLQNLWVRPASLSGFGSSLQGPIPAAFCHGHFWFLSFDTVFFNKTGELWDLHLEPCFSGVSHNTCFAFFLNKTDE